MDAIQLLTDQHRMLEERLAAAVAAADPRERAALAAEACDQLAVHVAAEEDVFGPALRRNQNGSLDPVDDHGPLKSLLADLTRRAADDPAYGPLLVALRTQVERHHVDEEARLFPCVARAFDADQREAMGRDILAYQKKMLRAGQPRCATRPVEAPPALPALVTV